MSFAVPGVRRFMSELSALLDKKVLVRTIQGRTYEGVLLGFEPNALHICLGNVEDDKGNKFSRVFLNGDAISEILSVEELLDLRELAIRLERVFPNMVKYYEEARVIVVADRIKVTERGVEGTGTLAERVKEIYEKFIAEKRARVSS